MSPEPRPALREVTPEQRAKSVRTFVWILVAFAAGLGMLVASLAWQGRVNREYGQAVYRAVMASRPDVKLSYEQPCAAVLSRPLPAGVVGCEVVVAQGQATVTVQLEGNRQYQVNR